MANVTFQLVLGDDREVYAHLIDALPPGENNLRRGVVVPAHPTNKPQTFQLSGLTAHTPYMLDVEGEWHTAPTPRRYFVPIGETHNLVLALPYGPSTITIHNVITGEVYRFLASVVNYAVLFRSYAREITEYSKLPLMQLEQSISSDLSYRLTLPMLTGLTSLIAVDLEALSVLAHKLLVKNLLHDPGTLGATRDILAAFSASNPVFFPMKNITKLDAPMFRSEEVYQGHEAHIWLPNNEVERWSAFILLLNNLPQLYTLKQVTETDVYVQQGGKLRRHVFDFNSPLANSITTGLAYLIDCFLNLFSLTVTVESEHTLSFCQATYTLDQRIDNSLIATDADAVGIVPWQSFSLSGRFGQQYDIMPAIHEWHYDTPVRGQVDGVNRFFSLSHLPNSTSAVKVFVDGLLKSLYRDYRISLSGNIISSAYRVLTMPQDNILIDVQLGLSRPFVSPVFSALEARESANLQKLLTSVETGLSSVAFIISHPPHIEATSSQAIAIHYATPKLLNTDTIGDNQWQRIAMDVDTSSYTIVYERPTATLNYQLLVSLSVDDMPGNDPKRVGQYAHLVREKTQTGAVVEFSAALSEGVFLNYWVIEEDSIVLERGTFILSEGQTAQSLLFANGPYFDQVVIILQLWEIYPSFVDAGIYLTSMQRVGPGGTTIRISSPIVGSGYRLDYVVFPARDGDFVEFFQPPLGLIEAHYDVAWPHWLHAELSPSPDGIRTTFSLPYPITHLKSLYLALNGRLMTQGANNQYIVSENNTVTFMFPPTQQQLIWAVYPVSTLNAQLPSNWDQGFLNYLPSYQGQYATGWIKLLGPILVDSYLTIDKARLDAVATANGLITNSTAITIGSSLSWGKLGVMLTAIPNIPTSEGHFQVGLSKDDDARSLATAINNHSIINNYYTAYNIASGFVVVKANRLGGTLYNDTLSAFGMLTATNITGDSAPNSYNTCMLYHGEYVVSLPSDDVVESSFYKMDHPFYVGLGIKLVATSSCPQPLLADTLYYVVNTTQHTFQLSLTPYGEPITLLDSGSGYHTFISQNIELETSSFCYPTLKMPFTGVVSEGSYTISSVLPLVDNLRIGMSIYGDNIPEQAYIVDIQGFNQIIMNVKSLATMATEFTVSNAFKDREPIGFITTGSLPSGIVEGQKYYATNITENRFQVSETADSMPISLNSVGSGSLLIYSISRFVVGRDVELDAQSLAEAIAGHPIIRNRLTVNVDSGILKLTSREVGVNGNMRIAASDPNISYHSLSLGSEKTGVLYGASKICYAYNAPVVALDGLSTKLWVNYGGDKFKFTFNPTLKQESYYISEVYPMDHHPLDSTVANLPCNYPKGVFTQGFATHSTAVDINIVQTGDLVVATANLPVQERPQGMIDGYNKNFILSLSSCAGTDSLLIWLDGILQPSTAYTYTEMGNYGKITFTNAPSSSQVNLWAWYLPYGSSCVDERVRELIGVIDGENQTFTIPDAPWENNAALIVFLEGLFILQNYEYTILNSTQIKFVDTAPAIGQSLWSHYNLGSVLPIDLWQQVYLGTSDGTTTVFTIPHMISSDLPTSPDSVLVFLNGLNQGGHYVVEVAGDGNPTGNIIFSDAPEANRRVEVVYIRK